MSEEILPWYASLVLDAQIWEERGGLSPLQKQLRVGYVPGVMPGKWFSRWHERFDALTPLLEIPLAEGQGLAALSENVPEEDSTASSLPLCHMVLMRPDLESDAYDNNRFHCITLYSEQMVLVLPQDHLLTALDEISLVDLVEEFMLQDPASVPEWAKVSAEYRDKNPQKLPQMRHTQDAIELVAAGLGLLLVPMSVARFFHRKDLTYRPVIDMTLSPVALVWEKQSYPEDFEQTLQDFIGICRGRTESSDRGSTTKKTAMEQAQRAKEKEKAIARAKNGRREQADRKRRNAQKNGNARQHARQTSATQSKKRGKR